MKQFVLCGACILSGFFMGVATERRLAVDRVEARPDLNIEELVSAAGDKNQNVSAVDVTQLKYPEELTKSPSEETNNAPRKVVPAQVATTRGTDGMIFIQLGAYKNRDNAINAVADAKKKGFKVGMFKKGGRHEAPIYLVRLGPFQDLDKALPIMEKLKRKEFSYVITAP